MAHKLWYVYIVECEKDNSLYTGITTDVAKRVKAHNENKGAAYTKSRGPINLVYFETVQTKSEALKREYQIKQLSREQKLKLIQDDI